jgi:hypothetical protein
MDLDDSALGVEEKNKRGGLGPMSRASSTGAVIARFDHHHHHHRVREKQRDEK